jgi:hypothetical protein
VLPRGRADYTAEIRELSLRLYDRASPSGTRYFLDKTPRYHLISEELVAAFPEAKFLFLWRNPLAVVASIIETWANGRWNVYRFKVDLFDGLENLLSTYERHGTKIHAMRYEDLVEEPAKTWSKAFDYLDLPFDSSALELFDGTKLAGRMGDRSGVAKYTRVSNESVEGWKRTLNTPVRKAWCRRYLRWIGRDRLRMMGYDLDGLMAELECIPISYRGIGSDAGRGCWGLIRDVAEPRILGQKWSKMPAWRYVHTHR